MKNNIKYLLQKAFGFERFLYIFSIIKIKTLKYDKNEKDFFKFLSLLKPQGGAILDIGANIGLMTYHLAKAFPQDIIHSFEPMPFNLESLQKVVSKNKLANVRIHPIALGQEEGSVSMILPVQDGAKMQGLSHVKHETITDWNEGEEFVVDMKMLDLYLPLEQVQGIKIDVENFEYFVLKGGEKILRTFKPIIYAELWDNENRTQCFDLLNDLGYKTYVVIDHQLVLFDANLHNKQNFIFVEGLL